VTHVLRDGMLRPQRVTGEAHIERRKMTAGVRGLDLAMQPAETFYHVVVAAAMITGVVQLLAGTCAGGTVTG
jgi:hypothetical protein